MATTHASVSKGGWETDSTVQTLTSAQKERMDAAHLLIVPIESETTYVNVMRGIRETASYVSVSGNYYIQLYKFLNERQLITCN